MQINAQQRADSSQSTRYEEKAAAEVVDDEHCADEVPNNDDYNCVPSDASATVWQQQQQVCIAMILQFIHNSVNISSVWCCIQ
jgi:hypothetical protein